MKSKASPQNKNISLLVTKLELLSCDLSELDGRMTKLDNTIEAGEGALNTPKLIAEKLGELDILLTTLDGALTALSAIPVPPIPPIMQTLEKAVNVIKETVHAIKVPIERLEKLLEPLRKYLHQVRGIINEILPPLKELTEFTQQEHGQAQAASEKLGSMGESRYHKGMEAKYDDIARRLNTALDAPLHSLTDSLEKINQSSDSLDKALNKCNELSKSLKPITETMEELQALDNELDQLKAILDQKIGTPPVEMSVKEVLTIAGKNPVFEELSKIAMQLLKEPLRELKEMVPGCPNLVGLIESFEAVYQLLNLIKELMSTAEPEIRKLTKDKYLVKIFDRVEA